MGHPSESQPDAARRFAVEVVRKLRQAGHEAYWAGGCVRDRLLGQAPKDYDVATDAEPRQVRKLFGHRRTLAIGASFGVITVLGPKGAGQVEVATFREDAEYSDGRHPDGVRFSSAEADASRRDFTINGLFYDPLDDRVIDFVGGLEDLRAGRIRAIGDPAERFAEDKLRMLRALRFTVRFGFELDQQTFGAVRRMARQVRAVSPERISAEVRQMLTDRRRAVGWRLLVDSGLAELILPEVTGKLLAAEDVDRTAEVLERLEEPQFPLAFAVVLQPFVDAVGSRAIGRRWRLANKETDRIAWLLTHHGALDGANDRPWSAVQRILVAEDASDLLNWMQAERDAAGVDDSDVRWCREQRARSSEEIDPAPLLTGADLIEHGVPRGPIYRELLERVRDAQLDAKIGSADEALALVDRLRHGA